MLYLSIVNGAYKPTKRNWGTPPYILITGSLGDNSVLGGA